MTWRRDCVHYFINVSNYLSVTVICTCANAYIHMYDLICHITLYRARPVVDLGIVRGGGGHKPEITV